MTSAKTIQSIEELRQKVSAGFKFKYLFFWGHQSHGDTVEKTCLSQWYPADFMDSEHRYASAEHYMMAQKALLFGDHDCFQKILQATHPGAAKALGREVRGFVQERWNAMRINYVVRGNLLKFSQNNDLKQFLLSTGERVLVEASPLDDIWGIGVDEKQARSLSVDQWPGLNLLGFALMQVREKTRIGDGE